MTVRDRVGRWRHVVFEAARPAPSRGEMAAALDRAVKGARLTRYESGVGVVRVPHTAAREAVAAAGVRTLGSSGTIRAAVAKFAPQLARRLPRGEDARPSGAAGKRSPRRQP